MVDGIEDNTAKWFDTLSKLKIGDKFSVELIDELLDQKTFKLIESAAYKLGIKLHSKGIPQAKMWTHREFTVIDRITNP